MPENYDNNIKSSLDDIDVPENISTYISKGVRKRRYQNGAGMICKCLIALMININIFTLITIQRMKKF